MKDKIFGTAYYEEYAREERLDKDFQHGKGSLPFPCFL